MTTVYVVPLPSRSNQQPHHQIVSINPTRASLFHPFTFAAGDITLRNRLILAPISGGSPRESDGAVGPADVAYLHRRSHGVGMVLTAACSVVDRDWSFGGLWDCASEASIPTLRSVAEGVRSAGAISVLTLHHPGRGGMGATGATPAEMTEAEIEEAIAAFGGAARRAIQAGFDGVEIDGAGGALLQQFFSPASNARRDQWGGVVEHRAAFPIAVLEEVREVVRRNAYRPFAIGFRVVPEEIDTPGIVMEETMELVEGLVACRPNWLHVATPDYFAGSIRNRRDLLPRAAKIARSVAGRTAVIGVGSILTHEQASRVLDDGVDLVGLGRALEHDPDWVEKVVEGREEEILTAAPLLEQRPYADVLGRRPATT